MANSGSRIYQKLGVRPVINAGGNTTVWGGSTPSPEVRKAMDEADSSYVEVKELLERSGGYIADVLGVDAAHVTSGCFASLVLSTAACIAGPDPEKSSRLPDTAGMNNEIVTLKALRYPYQRSHRVAGGVLVEAGDEDGCTADQLAGAIGPKTAAVAYVYQPDVYPANLALEDVTRVAHDRGVPVILDAASQIFPLDHFRRIAQSGDLVCFGAKYISAPQSTGFLCGRGDLVEAAATQGFIGFETGGGHSFGRGYKVDRQDIVGVVAALEAWFAMDHEDRLTDYRTRLATIERAVDGIPGVSAELTIYDSYVQLALHIVLDGNPRGMDAQQLADDLLADSPRIRVNVIAEDTIFVAAHTLNEGEESIIADRLRGLLAE
jgi:D-glucosaminate-6-phosphate ammonia-lyase